VTIGLRARPSNVTAGGITDGEKKELTRVEYRRKHGCWATPPGMTVRKLEDYIVDKAACDTEMLLVAGEGQTRDSKPGVATPAPRIPAGFRSPPKARTRHSEISATTSRVVPPPC
jgi:hypothetical protein